MYIKNLRFIHRRNKNQIPLRKFLPPCILKTCLNHESFLQKESLFASKRKRAVKNYPFQPENPIHKIVAFASEVFLYGETTRILSANLINYF